MIVHRSPRRSPVNSCTRVRQELFRKQRALYLAIIPLLTSQKVRIFCKMRRKSRTWERKQPNRPTTVHLLAWGKGHHYKRGLRTESIVRASWRYNATLPKSCPALCTWAHTRVQYTCVRQKSVRTTRGSLRAQRGNTTHSNAPRPHKLHLPVPVPRDQ